MLDVMKKGVSRLLMRVSQAVLGSVIFSVMLASAQGGIIGNPGGGSGGSGGGTTSSDPLFQFDELARQDVDGRLESYGAGLMGDTVDPYTGSVVFEHVDVSLPGNSDLEVAVRRRREQGRVYSIYANAQFGDWTIDTPRITTQVARTINNQGGGVCNVYAAGTFCIGRRPGLGLPAGAARWLDDRCTIPIGPGPINIAASQVGNGTPISEGSFINDYEYSSGVTLRVPGQGAKQTNYVKGDHNPIGSNFRYPNIYPSGTYRATLDGWIIRCGITAYAVNQSGSGLEPHGQGFIAIAPNGDEYRFDRVTYRDHVENYDGGITITEASVHATEVKDVNGNWVRYDYDLADRITRIHANDGREISFDYFNIGVDSPLIESVTANGRTWRYTYGQNHDKHLFRVDLPDGRHWRFGLTQMDWGPEPGNCTQSNGDTVSFSLDHPNGAEAEFRLRELRHGRTRIPSSAVQNPPSRCPYANSPAAKVPYFEAMSVVRKTLTASGKTYNWTYNYIGDNGSFGSPGAADLGVGGLTSQDLKRTEVVDPMGAMTRYTHSRRWGLLEGKLIKMERFQTASGGTPLETIDYTYQAEQPIGFSYLYLSNVAQITTPVRQREITVTRGSDVYNTRYTYGTTQNSTSYSYGAPTRIEQWSNTSGGTRITETTYEHNKSEWVIGLPKQVRRNGKTFDEYTYDGLGRLTNYKRFGQNYKTYTYHSSGVQNGALASVTDALGRRHDLTSWKRGTPRTVGLPDGNDLIRAVDDNGWVTTSKNARGYETHFGFDSMGRLTQINPPGNRATTHISYSNSGSGIIQTSTTGTQRITTRYDSLNRPYHVETTALSGGGGTIHSRTEYDELGRVTFQSFPSFNSNESTGAETSYDALGRVTRVRENVSPFATTNTAYLSGNRIRVTDPEGHTTTTTRSGYGSPDDGNPVTIQMPEGVTNTMTYDIHGNLLTSNQGGLTQTWTYDNRLRLNTHYTPEEGCRIYGYNNANEVTSIGHGSTASCSAAGGSTIYNSYDTLGRLTLVNYPPGTADVTMTYDDNGNILTNDRGGANWTYTWDENDQLLTETLDIDDRTFSMGHQYNSNGARTVWVAPNLADWNFKPDGHGRPTQARFLTAALLDNATYHPNGQLKRLDYRNGVYYETRLDARQLVNFMHHSNVFIQSMGHDKNGRIIHINDWLDNDRDREYDYDGLGRLLEADGPWGTGSYSYDTRNNLTRKRLGYAVVDLEYNNKNQVSRYQHNFFGGFSRTYVHDARGNVTDNGQISFIYDRANQPIAISGASTGSFLYDGNYKRVKQTINDETIYTIYNLAGEMVWRDNATTGQTVAYLNVGGQTVRPGAGRDESYIHNDHLGSPVAATNGLGVVTWREDYNPFGEPRLDPAGNADNQGFTGHIRDADTGLVYMQARYYDPHIGRFLSPDPVGFATGGPAYFNRYAYVANDPVNAIDPDGREICDENCLAVAGEIAHGSTPEQAVAQVNSQDSLARKAVAVAGVHAAAAAVGLSDGFQPGPVDAVAQGTASKFTKSLMEEASAIAIDAAINGISGQTAPEGAKVSVPDLDSAASGPTFNEVGVASDLRQENARLNVSKDALQAKPKTRVGKAVEFFRAIVPKPD